MQFWNWVMLALILVAACISIRNRRGLAWIGALALDYTISVAYWRTGLPWGEVVTGACDAAVCFTIYGYYRQRWELVVYGTFLASLAVDIYFLAGNLAVHTPWGQMISISQDTYGSLLELLNLLALLSIGGVSIVQLRGANVLARGPDRRLDGLVRALGSSRTSRPWYKVP